jgi:hypothetical protein
MSGFGRSVLVPDSGLSGVIPARGVVLHLVRGFGEPFDRLEPSVPVVGELRHGLRRLVEPARVDPEEDFAAHPVARHEAGVLENGEVLDDGLAGEGDVLREGARRRLAATDEQIEDPATRQVGDRRPQLVARIDPHPAGVASSSLRRARWMAQPSRCSSA